MSREACSGRPSRLQLRVRASWGDSRPHGPQGWTIEAQGWILEAQGVVASMVFGQPPMGYGHPQASPARLLRPPPPERGGRPGGAQL